MVRTRSSWASLPEASEATFRIVPGRYRVILLPTGSDRDCAAVEEDLVLRDPGPTEVRLGSRPKAISVRVRLPRGASVRRASLRRSVPFPPIRAAIEADPDGLYRSPPLPPGRYRLQVWFDLGEKSVMRELDDLTPGAAPAEIDPSTPR